VYSDVLRLVAEVALDSDAEGTRWLRILGDVRRGYLIVGDIDMEGMVALDDFWFPTLDGAIAAAERAGVPRSVWEVDTSSPASITERLRNRAARG
jgi:hypothetical protein